MGKKEFEAATLYLGAIAHVVSDAVFYPHLIEETPTYSVPTAPYQA